MKTVDVLVGIHRGLFLAEHHADGCGSFAAVERSLSDRLLDCWKAASEICAVDEPTFMKSMRRDEGMRFGRC